MKIPVSVLVLTRNEEANIAQCLGSVCRDSGAGVLSYHGKSNGGARVRHMKASNSFFLPLRLWLTRGRPSL
jgi:hypothetical protein